MLAFHNRLRVLICEDEYLLASDLASELARLGVEITAFAQDYDSLQRLAHSPKVEVEAAVLDIMLKGKLVFPAVDLFRRRGVRVVFYTGYLHRDVPAEFADVPLVSKPADGRAMLQLLTALRT